MRSFDERSASREKPANVCFGALSRSPKTRNANSGAIEKVAVVAQRANRLRPAPRCSSSCRHKRLAHLAVVLGRKELVRHEDRLRGGDQPLELQEGLQLVAWVVAFVLTLFKGPQRAVPLSHGKEGIDFDPEAAHVPERVNPEGRERKE